MRTPSVALLVLAGLVSHVAGANAQTARPVEALRTQAAALRPLVDSQLAKDFLDATADLPAIDETRIVHWNGAARQALTADEAAAKTEEELASYRRMELGEQFYYFTAFGTPLAYTRVLDLAAGAGFESADGKRTLDFGFGTIGHLRLLASLGAHAAGIEVLDLLRAMYGPDDVGEIERAAVAGDGRNGSISLIFGSFPGDAAVAKKVGAGYDLITSKNTLKGGYIHPKREVDPRFLVHLGVDDRTFMTAMYDALNPGGVFLIYNLYGKPRAEDEPYEPMRSGDCPFDRDLLKEIGFEIVAFDVDDTEFAHTMARAFRWDQSMDLENDLFAMYTILRKPR